MLKWLSFACGAALVLGAAYGYGRWSHKNGWFPEALVDQAITAVYQLKAQAKDSLPGYLVAVPDGPALSVSDNPAPGYRLLSNIQDKGLIVVDAVDETGALAHRWNLDFFDTWKAPTDHIDEAALPKERPGAAIEGMVVSPNGDLTFNYGDIGMVQVDICGKVKWTVPRQTHHSLVQEEDGDYWATSVFIRTSADPRLPNYRPPYRDFQLVEVSPEGKIKREISVADLLLSNGLAGDLYLSTRDNESTEVSGDTLHVNDVDIFPSTMKPGVAKAGDIMVSLRNINTVLIFDPITLKIKSRVSGRFVRQHDPDFVDGDHITLFDNNNVSNERGKAQSRVISIDLRDEAVTVLYSGTPEKPFFTHIMGRADRMLNGDYLMPESSQGRVIEVSPDGRIVWDYRHLVRPGVATQIQDMAFTTVDLKTLSAPCKAG